jgi:hypothetical protein
VVCHHVFDESEYATGEKRLWNTAVSNGTYFEKLLCPYAQTYITNENIIM